MNKSKFLLFILTLYSTSAAFAMDKESEEQQPKTCSSTQTTVAKKRTIKEVKKARKTSFYAVLSLYEEQAEYHQHMHELLTQPREKLRSTMSAEDTEESNKIIMAIFGIPAEKILVSSDTEGSLPIGEEIKKISVTYQIAANSYKNIFENRQKNFDRDENSIFAQLAALYLGAVENYNDIQDNLREEKENLASFSEEEIKAFYKVKLFEDKCAFYKLVQKKILEEFKLNKNKIFDELICLCKNVLEKERKLELFQDKLFEVFIKKHSNILGDALKNEQKTPLNLKMSAKNMQFCEDVINGRYQFPSLESFEELALAFDTEEEKMIGAAQETTATSGVNYEKNKKQRERKKRAKQKKQAQQSTSSSTSTMSPVNSTDDGSEPNLPQSEEQQTIVTTSHTEHKESSEVCPKEKTAVTELPSLLQYEEKQGELDSTPLDLEKVYEKDRQTKKKKHKKVTSSMSTTVELKDGPRAKINKKKHEFLTEILGRPVNLSLRWKRIVTLFNSPSGFKGKVYGGKDGSTNTFEIYIKFQKGRITGFLSEQEFQKLKEDAEPESRAARNFLPENERLQSYKLNSGESIGTSFFTLHNPHPYAFAYRDLVERLQKQLGLLGITPETIRYAED